MGRKKKETVVEEQKVSEQKEKETNKSTSGSIGYQGKINVKVQRGNKTISSKTYHNTGKQILFKFLCNCIAGKYLESLRPVKIRLISGNSGEPTDNTSSWANAQPATPLFLTYSNVAAVENKENLEAYNVSYEFKIPYTYITQDAYKAALYISNESDQTKWSAIFGFIDDNGDWNPIEIANADQQFYTLVLTWTMTISNQGGNI